MKPDWNAVVKLGVPSVIACFLVYNLVIGFDKFDVRLQAVERQHGDMLTHAERTEDLMGRTYMSSERALYVLRAMCVNDAKTPEARRLCLEEPR